MLILSRKRQEAVVVSGTGGHEQLLKVTVLDVRGSSVKLGFEAGNEVPIHRAEVWERIRNESPVCVPKPIDPEPEHWVPYLG